MPTLSPQTQIQILRLRVEGQPPVGTLDLTIEGKNYRVQSGDVALLALVPKIRGLLRGDGTPVFPLIFKVKDLRTFAGGTTTDALVALVEGSATPL